VGVGPTIGTPTSLDDSELPMTVDDSQAPTTVDDLQNTKMSAAVRDG
jgi:hypothetical protein